MTLIVHVTIRPRCAQIGIGVDTRCTGKIEEITLEVK
jgi:hypothetical protein